MQQRMGDSFPDDLLLFSLSHLCVSDPFYSIDVSPTSGLKSHSQALSSPQCVSRTKHINVKKG
jgi:hypothetical protein